MRFPLVLLLPSLSGCTLCVSVDRVVVLPPEDAAPGEDAGPADAGGCPGATDEAPSLVWPWNGAYTGSLHAPGTRRPAFRWAPVTLADGSEAAYQILVDDSCPIGGHADCEMPDPEIDRDRVDAQLALDADLPVSEERPVGSRYAWRVRACDSCSRACGPWSATRYLEVGREAHDVDGDGYADLLVGAFGKNGAQADEGAAYLFLGGPDGVAPTATASWAGPTAQLSTYFGRGLAIADVDADGFGDMIVSSYAEDAPEVDEGVVRIFRGGPTGPSAVADFVLDDPVDQVGTLLGVTVADAGDVDADGYRDVFVDAHFLDAPAMDEGGFYVFDGGPDGVGPWPQMGYDAPDDQPSTLLGYTVCAGDLDDDGLGDLVVGAVLQDGSAADTGRIAVFRGRPDGLGDVAVQTIDDPAGALSDQFGTLACAGDLDGDGRGDVLVGALYTDGAEADEGVVYLYRGAEGGLDEAAQATFASPTVPAAGSMFGAELAGLGDVDGDGHSDFLVGAPAYVVGAGAAYLYLADEAGGFRDPIEIPSPTGEVDGRFGGEVAGLGDVDGDGFVDFAIGAPSMTVTDSGAAYAYRGGPDGLAAGEPVSLTNPAPLASDQFGLSIAWRNPGL